MSLLIYGSIIKNSMDNSDIQVNVGDEDMDTLWLLTEILMINLVLSGDNAVVIALASKDLPPIQRKKAVWWGLLVRLCYAAY